jgi:hypothetical protein
MPSVSTNNLALPLTGFESVANGAGEAADSRRHVFAGQQGAVVAQRSQAGNLVYRLRPTAADTASRIRLVV